MSQLEPDVIAAIQAIQSESDYYAADDRVKEALKTWEVDDPDSYPSVPSMVDDPPIQSVS